MGVASSIDIQPLHICDNNPQQNPRLLIAQCSLIIAHCSAQLPSPPRYNSVLKVSPLHVALGPSSRAGYQTVELLVEALGPGALQARDWAGQTPLHLAAQVTTRLD